MTTEPLSLDTKTVIRRLLDVAKVALGPTMPDLSDDEALELLDPLLALVKRTMPPDLQAQDVRVLSAQVVRDLMLP